jgi:hypothetical protein
MFQKTHRCVKCRRTLLLRRVNPVFETDDVDEAIKCLQELKKRAALKTGWIDFIAAYKLPCGK